MVLPQRFLCSWSGGLYGYLDNGFVDCGFCFVSFICFETILNLTEKLKVWFKKPHIHKLFFLSHLRINCLPSILSPASLCSILSVFLKKQKLSPIYLLYNQWKSKCLFKAKKGHTLHLVVSLLSPYIWGSVTLKFWSLQTSKMPVSLGLSDLSSW